MQEKIRYVDIMELGFTEEIINDKVFFDEYGYDYSVIQLNLTKKIYLDWEKETQLCSIIRQDKHQNIKKEAPIKNLNHLKEVVDFFLGECPNYDITKS